MSNLNGARRVEEIRAYMICPKCQNGMTYQRATRSYECLCGKVIFLDPPVLAGIGQGARHGHAGRGNHHRRDSEARGE